MNTENKLLQEIVKFYGKDILGGTGRISVQEAVEYASMSMTPEMKEKYIDSTF